MPLNKWFFETRTGLKYSVKASRVIIHIKRLKDTENYLDNLMEKVKLLSKKLAILLFQSPPQITLNLERLEKFLPALPQENRAIFEFRHASWEGECLLPAE
jgi:uncharacterized protein YecE (DUF72 family)